MKSITLSSKIIFCYLLLLVASPSHAVVITSGCASSTACSLSELYAGASISINDVVFDNWNFNFTDGDSIDISSVLISGIDESVSTTPGESTVGLSVLFNPELLVEFIEYDFDFSTSIIGSSRLLVGAGLALVDSTINGDGYVEINNGLSTGNLLSVDADGAASSSASFAGITSLVSDSDFQMETFDNEFVGLSQYDYEFTIMGSTASVPEAGSLALLLITLIGTSCLQRKRKTFKLL